MKRSILFFGWNFSSGFVSFIVILWIRWNRRFRLAAPAVYQREGSCWLDIYKSRLSLSYSFSLSWIKPSRISLFFFLFPEQFLVTSARTRCLGLTAWTNSLHTRVETRVKWVPPRGAQKKKNTRSKCAWRNPARAMFKRNKLTMRRRHYLCDFLFAKMDLSIDNYPLIQGSIL